MFNEKPEAGTVIKVIAVGGGGGNIVDHMNDLFNFSR